MGEPGFSPKDVTYEFISDGTRIDPPPVKSTTTRSMSYDASQEKLTITDDTVTDTGIDGDPLVSSEVNVPPMMLTGPPVNGEYQFQSQPGAMFSLSSGSIF